MTNAEANILYENDRIDGLWVAVDCTKYTDLLNNYSIMCICSKVIDAHLPNIKWFIDNNLSKYTETIVSCTDGCWHSAAIAGSLNQYYNGKSKYWFQNYTFDRKLYDSLLQFCRKGRDV